MAMRVNGAPAVVSAILIEEDNHQRRDQNKGGRSDVIDKVEERINASPVWGYILRKPLHHEISQPLMCEELFLFIPESRTTARGGMAC